MANLDFIKKLNIEYLKESPIAKSKEIISERINPDKIEKSLFNYVQNLGPEYLTYFEYGLPADIALLFIDICNFSTRYSDLNGEQIGQFFDKYYDIIIPIIYEYGGEVDKIIGDGIICIFGPPFYNHDIEDCILKADKCAKKIIKETKNTEFSSKIAFHSGTINYFKNKTQLYEEFTVIGKPLTELFRLESVSINDRINYYEKTEIREYYEEIIEANQNNSQQTKSKNSKSRKAWLHEFHKIDKLKGTSFNGFYSVDYNA